MHEIFWLDIDRSIISHFEFEKKIAGSLFSVNSEIILSK